MTSTTNYGAAGWTWQVPARHLFIPGGVGAAPYHFDGPLIYYGILLASIAKDALLVTDQSSTSASNGQIDAFDASAPLGTFHGIAVGTYCLNGVTLSPAILLGRADVILFYRMYPDLTCP